MKKILAGLALLLTLVPGVLAGRGTVTIESVSGSGPYSVTLNSVSGITVGDVFGCILSSGAGAVYEITAINTSTRVLTVTDTIYAAKGSAYGSPAVGATGWYDTPPTGSEFARPPYLGRGWDAAHQYNAEIASYAGIVLDASGDAAVSSSTSSYSAIGTTTLKAKTFWTVGDSVVVTCNLRQASGSGVHAKLSVGGTSTTDMAIVGKCTWEIVRTNDGNLTVFGTNQGATCAYTKDSVSGLNYTATIDVSITIEGGSTAGGTAVDFWRVERKRGR